jgi:hypothetical protein
VSTTPGDPETHWDLGVLTPGNAQGWERNIPIRHLAELVLDPLNRWTKVGYSLEPGVTLTLTELAPA